MESKYFTTEQAEQIGKSLGIKWDKFNIDQFLMGINVELEHGIRDLFTNVTNDDIILTGKIALAHLNEFPDYYTRLKKMEDEAERFWKKDTDNKKIMTNMLSANGTVRGVYFSLGTTPATNDPKFDCKQAIIDLFDQAKIVVHVAIYSLTEPDIVNAMIRANNRGIKIEIISDAIESKSKKQANMIKKLTQSGINVHLAVRQKSLMHNKIAIFDNQTICTGSFNWTVNAEKNNDENLLVVDGQDLANAY
jgi:phosphatidylserine/phosphatidylglycerophosphate/cardiolipin synthase-like enzyme